MFIMFVSLLISFCQTPAGASEYKISPAISFSHQKEQIKDASGSSSGVLVSNRHLSLMLPGTYSLFPFLDLGVFILAERGARTVINGPVVDYTLFWTGPMVRGNWNSLFLEIAYVFYGTRMDKGLSSITSGSGDNSSEFRTDPSKAFLFAPGITFSLSDAIDLLLKIEYRLHYYNRRGSDEIVGNASIGSQAVRPHLGVQFKL